MVAWGGFTEILIAKRAVVTRVPGEIIPCAERLAYYVFHRHGLTECN
jgi:hypothetical protein